MRTSLGAAWMALWRPCFEPSGRSALRSSQTSPDLSVLARSQPASRGHRGRRRVDLRPRRRAQPQVDIRLVTGTYLRCVGSIRGRYEWDDDDLTPGRKREGGLHQNLFDRDGNLKANARFIPAEDDEPLVITETVYLPIEERRRTCEDEQFEAIVNAVVSHLIDRGIAAAKPYAQRLWREKSVPVIDNRRDQMKHAWRKRATAKDRREPSAQAKHVTVVESTELVQAEAERPRMSRSEAEARYLAALAARAYSDEQMRLINGAEIIDGSDVDELEQTLAELPPAQLRRLVAALVKDPGLLREDSLAQLASALSRQASPASEHPPQPT